MAIKGPDSDDTPRSGKEEAFQALVEDILSNRLLPGQPLVERVLAERFNLSRTPIREVLRRLERDKLVEVYPNQGVFVRRQTARDIQDLFQLRIALEPVAASLAARNRPEDELLMVQKEFKGKANPERREASELVALGASLHDAIIRWTGNQLLLEIYEQLRKQTKLLRNLMQQRVDLEAQSFEEHVAILDAIGRKDVRLAEDRMREHLRRTNEDVLGWLAGR